MSQKRSTLTPDQYKQLLRERIADEQSLVRATFSGRLRGHDLAWKKVSIRPVTVGGSRKLQFSYFDAAKDISKNYSDGEIGERLDEVLAMPFKIVHLATATQDIQVNVSRNGDASVLIKEAEHQRPVQAQPHDRVKRSVISADAHAPFLNAVGITAHDGKVRSGMQAKLAQVNQFLKLIEETGVFQDYPASRINVADLGCGNAYLTFAAYHYLTFIRELETHMVGVDVKGDLLESHVEKARMLGWENMQFEATSINSYDPEVAPDMVMALHACDTATDDAIARGVRWGSRLIFTAPCCHHHLQAQLGRQRCPEPFGPVLHHGILKERMGDILTDTFRALILRMLGYRTDVVQFVSSEHTPKNLMIRAVKTRSAGASELIREYEQLRDYWRVQPYLGQILAPKLEALTRDNNSR